MTCCLKKNLTLFLTLLLLGTGVWGVSVKYRETVRRTQAQETPSQDAPRLAWDHTDFDWGDIPQDQKVTHDFPIRNQGTRPLKISQIRTSCNCTTAEIQAQGEVQPLPAVLAPGEEGMVHVTFDPLVMDSRGDIQRAVRIETNDPLMSFLVFNLTAHVR